MESVRHLTRYIPNIAKTASTLIALLKNSDKHKKLDWKPEYTSAFHNILKLVSEVTENKHFNQNLATRGVCVVPRGGKKTVLEQNIEEDWVAIAFASRCLNILEEKNSVNELELLGDVWSIKHFKYYYTGKFHSDFRPLSFNQRTKGQRTINV